MLLDSNLFTYATKNDKLPVFSNELHFALCNPLGHTTKLNELMLCCATSLSTVFFAYVRVHRFAQAHRFFCRSTSVRESAGWGILQFLAALKSRHVIDDKGNGDDRGLAPSAVITPHDSERTQRCSEGSRKGNRKVCKLV